MPAAAVLLPAAALALLAPGGDEPHVRVQLLDNPRFDEPLPERDFGSAPVPIPWWRATLGAQQLERRGDAVWINVADGLAAEQPVAAYEPTACRTRLRGRVCGRGRLTISDGTGASAVRDFDAPAEAGQSFELELGTLEPFASTPPVPRLLVRLEALENGTARWTDLEAWVELPCPSEAALRAEILGHLDWLFGEWTARALDDLGPRATGFACRYFDVVTGEPAGVGAGGLSTLFVLLLDALEVEERPAWRATFERFLDDFFALCFHPLTGLPCGWDVSEDLVVGSHPREVHAVLRFLLDLSERGPAAYRARALERALALGEHVLAAGVLPDGLVAPGYRPSDGSPSVAYPPLRQLDVPAQLARLGAISGDGRFTRAARAALATLEYTHFWPGTWGAIDPGFDDNYGHFGARALVMWRAHPENAAFRRIARGGLEHYAPLWRDALRLGGNVAADQVRCWEIAAQVAELAPEMRGEVAGLLRAAVRSHFKGEQYGNGAWGDVTIFGFDPRPDLQVGDFTGVPQNLVNGIAIAYEDRLGLRSDGLRAMFTAVMRSSVATYRRPYGYLSTRSEHSDRNPGGGALRFMPGLVEMLRKLSRPG